MDKTVNTLEGFLYQQLRHGVPKEMLEQFLFDELDAAMEIYESETAEAKKVNDLGAALEPFYNFIREYYPSLKGRVKPEEFEHGILSVISELEGDPAYIKLFISTLTGKDIPKVEVKEDEKVIYNFLKDNNLN